MLKFKLNGILNSMKLIILIFRMLHQGSVKWVNQFRTLSPCPYSSFFLEFNYWFKNRRRYLENKTRTSSFLYPFFYTVCNYPAFRNFSNLEQMHNPYMSNQSISQNSGYYLALLTSSKRYHH